MLVAAAPTLPTPKMPSAVPCLSFRKKSDVYATPTAKELPAMPNPRPPSAKPQKPFAKLVRNAAPAETSITRVKTARPPKRSVRIPAGSRSSEPVRTGSPMSHPICALSNAKTFPSTRNVTRTPFIIQTAKQTANAAVFAARTIQDLPRSLIGFPSARPARSVPDHDLVRPPEVRHRSDERVHETREAEHREEDERAHDVHLRRQLHVGHPLDVRLEPEERPEIGNDGLRVPGAPPPQADRDPEAGHDLEEKKDVDEKVHRRR